MPGHTSDVTSKINDCINNLSSSEVINFEMKVQDFCDLVTCLFRTILPSLLTNYSVQTSLFKERFGEKVDSLFCANSKLTVAVVVVRIYKPSLHQSLNQV